MEPIFKVGDKVRVKPREGNEWDYDFVFIDEMAAMEGEIFEIASILPDKAKNDRKYKCDGADYTLKDSSWSWASSMLELVNDEPLTTEEKKNYVLNKQN